MSKPPNPVSSSAVVSEINGLMQNKIIDLNREVADQWPTNTSDRLMGHAGGWMQEKARSARTEEEKLLQLLQHAQITAFSHHEVALIVANIPAARDHIAELNKILHDSSDRLRLTNPTIQVSDGCHTLTWENGDGDGSS